MTDHVPSLLILVPGPFRQPGEVVSILSRHEVDATVAGGAPFAAGSVEIDIVEDPGLGVSVARSCTELPAGLRASLEGASRAALVEIGRRLDEDLATLATVGRTLREMGGLAVRMERSGHAMDWTTWISRVEGNDPRSLLALGTLLCRDDDGQTFTCGMHHFDLPDAEVALDDPAEAAYWLEALSLYQIVESPTLTPATRSSPTSARRAACSNAGPTTATCATTGASTRSESGVHCLLGGRGWSL